MCIFSGKLINSDSLDKKPVTKITTVSQWDENAAFHQLTGKKKREEPERNTLFTCENPGCVESFETSHELEDHLILGECNLKLEKEKSKDKIKYIYADKLQLGCLRSNVTISCNSNSKGNSKLQRGWAIKEAGKRTQFNDNQRSYLTEKFQMGNKTGRKEDPAVVAEDMRKVLKSGERRFTFEELLTPQQIAGFFSRICKKSKMEEKDVISLCKEDLIDTLHEQINCV